MTTITPQKEFVIPGTPDWVAVGPDALWFSHRPSLTLNRLDPKRNEIISKIDIGKTSCSGMVYGFGSMWLPHCGENALYRVSTTEEKVLAVIPVGPAASEGGLTVSKDAVWMLAGPKGILTRIDPGTNKVVVQVETPGCYDAAFGFDSVWVTCTDTDQLLQVNPKTNKVERSIPAPNGPRFLAVGEGAIWTLNEKDGSVSRFNPRSGKLEANIPCGVPKAGDIAVGEGAVWVSSFEFPLTRIDPKKNTVTGQWKGKGGDAIRVGFGSVWMSYLREGYIWRIDPSSLP